MTLSITLSIFQMMVGNDGEFVSNAEKLQNVNEIQTFSGAFIAMGSWLP